MNIDNWPVAYLAPQYAWVVLALQHQKRRLGVLEVRQGAGRLVDCLIFDGITQQAGLIQPEIGRSAHREPVDDVVLVDPRSPPVGRFCTGHQRHIPTIGAACDADSRRIDIGESPA